MVAEEETPLAGFGDVRGLRHDVGNGQAIFLAERHVDARHQGEVEGHLAFVSVAKVGAYVGGPHVGLGQDEAVFVLGVDGGSDFLDLVVGFGDVFTACAVAFEEVGDGVQTQTVDSHVHPETHGVENLFHDSRVVEVEIRLV